MTRLLQVPRLGLAGWALALFTAACHAGEAPTIAFTAQPGKLQITVGGQPLATYVYQDEQIPRPYFAQVCAPGGIQVTRNHPPVAGTDATDHATMHPGIWLAFGDLSGADNWRNRARVRQDTFVEEPKGGRGSGSFAVRNHYLSADGKQLLCQETCRYTIRVRPAGYLILWDSEFRPEGPEVVFGDQEEMGLGVRVATPLTVPHGGQITTNTGAKNEKQVRGQTADWCDYSGTREGFRIGVTLLPHPQNFRPSWYHARDYGLVVANPFGRQALTGGERSRVVVKPGETFRLRFGVLLHRSKRDQGTDLNAGYQDYLRQMAEASKNR
jgi:hypothetical protein